MSGRSRKAALLLLMIPVSLVTVLMVQGQPPAEPPPVPRGVEVLARGPVHEAFASLAADPVPTRGVGKRPPATLEEMPPDEKPEGAVVWIGGYWAWDDDRGDYLWVSGVWRTPPPGKRWIAGYWRERGEEWQWVPGFWANVEKEEAPQDLTYLPSPPAAPGLAAPGEPPTADSFYVPGYWTWTGRTYAWKAGYWARIQPGYVWVSSHYRWTPSGYLYIPGYWDLSISRRGILYAPVVIDHAHCGPTFVYTPTYVVRETVVVDSLFVRPTTCHYYFGDYYGATYSRLGFEASISFGRRCYDPVICYERYEHRHVPNWESTRISLVIARNEGRAPVPPRTLVQQNTIINKNVKNVTNVTNVKNVTNVTNIQNSEVLTTATKANKDKGIKTVALDAPSRQQARQQSRGFQEVTKQRLREEKADAAPTREPRVRSFKVPPARPVGPQSKTQGFDTQPPVGRRPEGDGGKPKDRSIPKPGDGGKPKDRTIPKIDPIPKGPGPNKDLGKPKIPGPGSKPPAVAPRLPVDPPRTGPAPKPTPGRPGSPPPPKKEKEKEKKDKKGR